jgi:hypothetical protein
MLPVRRKEANPGRRLSYQIQQKVKVDTVNVFEVHYLKILYGTCLLIE